ncbi:MAG: ABC transporter ATP-binding protein [Candidatus Hodarchaeota archaeon]
MSYKDPPSDLLIVNQDKIIFSSGMGKLTRQSEISATLANVLTLFSQRILEGERIDSIRFDNHMMVFLPSQDPKFPALAAVVLVPIEVGVKHVLPRMRIILNLMEDYLRGKIYDAKLPQLDCFNRVINYPSQALFLLPKTAEGVRSALVLLACFAHDFQISLEKITSRMFFVVKDDYLSLEKIIEKVDSLGVLSFFPLPSHLKKPLNKFCEIGHKTSIRQFFSAIDEEKPFQTFARLVGSNSNAFKMKTFIDNDEALEIMQSIASLDKVYDVYVRNEILQDTVLNPGRDIVTTLSSPLLKKMMEISKQKEAMSDYSHPQATRYHDLDQLDGFVRLKNVNRVYKLGNQQIYALKNLSLELVSGQLVVVLGPSGSGKTTLLNVIGGIDKCEGTIKVGDIEVTKLSKGKLTKYRREKCGFIFQFFNLIPVLNAMENIEYAVDLSKGRKMTKNEVRAKTEEYIKKIGLWEKRFMFPSQLSGGEQQQVAAARAFAKEPDILLCDEPTGELSVKEGKKVLAVIQGIIKERPNILVIVVTHNQKISLIGNKVIRLRSGEIDSIVSQSPTSAENITW